MTWSGTDGVGRAGVLRLSYAAGYAPTDGAPAAGARLRMTLQKQKQEQEQLDNATLPAAGARLRMTLQKREQNQRKYPTQPTEGLNGPPG